MYQVQLSFANSCQRQGLYILCFAFLVACLTSPAKAEDQGILQDTEQKLKQNKIKQQEPGGYLPPLQKQQTDADDKLVRETPPEDKIYIRQVDILGNKTLQRSAFQRCLSPVAGKSVSEDALLTLSQCISKVYIDAGFSLSRAIIPPQDVEGGRLKVKVIEGYISTYEIEGVSGDQYNISRVMKAVLAERPLTLKTLERQLLLLNDIPGLTVKDTSLEEIGEMTGVFRLALYVDYWKVWTSSSMDNRGSKAIGPLQNYSSLYFNSLLLEGDSIGLSYSSVPESGDELNYTALSIDIPLGGSGLRLQGYLNASKVKPSDQRKLQNTEYDRLSGGVSLNYALRRSLDFSAWIGGGIWSYSHEEEDIFGQYLNDDVRGISLNASLNFFDPLGAETTVYASLRKGLDIGEASKKGESNLSRFDGDPQFTRFNLTYARFQALNENWSFRIDTHLQLATQGLLSTEEYYLGGSRFGRGFESGIIGGDSVFASSIELRYYKNLNLGWLNGGQLYGFLDMGSIIDDFNPFSNGAFISSGGGGVRLYFDHGIEASFEVGIPINKADLNPADVDAAEYSFHISRSQKIKDLSLESIMAASPLGWLK